MKTCGLLPLLSTIMSTEKLLHKGDDARSTAVPSLVRRKACNSINTAEGGMLLAMVCNFLYINRETGPLPVLASGCFPGRKQKPLEVKGFCKSSKLFE